jgi:hypothetical protein
VLFTADLKAFADREPGRVKKEEGEVVVVKKEVEVEEVVLPMGTKRKATRVKVEVKMEEAEVEAVVKRRRTRSQKT